MMISFHLCFDLEYFYIHNFNITTDPFFLNYRILIVSLFLFLVGVSLALANKNGINWQKVKKRAAILGAASVAISVATYIDMPNSWVYFGVIHFIFVASILALPFIGHYKISLITAVLILALYFSGYLNMHPLFKILAPILHLPKGYTVDLVPLVPWFAVVLFGVAFVDLNFYKYLDIKGGFIVDKLSFLGKHALVIYLIHQPILFALFSIFT